MELVYHIGAHCTDEDGLLKCLFKNCDALSRQGILVPDPSRYRPILRDMLVSLRGQPATADMQQVILDATTDGAEARRLILVNQSFLCLPKKALGQNMLYPMAGDKAHWLAQLFPDDPCAFFLGIRNPATFIPALFVKSRESDFAAFLAGVDPGALTWSDMVRRIRAANPRARLTVWCNEDTPLIWPELLARLSDHGESTPLRGTDDLLDAIMQPAGLTRLRAYLDENPPTNEAQRRRIVAAFLDKYALPDAIDEEIDAPGWTEDLVEHLTERYEADLTAIQAIEGVDVITP
ncbi:hypothetical protein [Rhodovulum euryhalinum]|uniref:Sulfotransferase family protein n=1 Tax=Rhodovulum euryhalinum TaxID=35805 RepID=A0A4V2S9Q1_9RHOB|nr:hypothetical protein [Rhodovulum euryhalinum]TCO68780.1 hypothetical protein EV655_1235 [Rhodovulum euryhalinum]